MVFSATGCKHASLPGDATEQFYFSAEDWIHYPCRAEWNTAYISGAGDVFLAALAMAGIQGMPLEAACIAANEAASAAAGRIGTMEADAATWEKLSRNNKT